MSFVLDAMVQDQQFHLMKNLAIIGGLAYVMAYGAGSLSLDAEAQTVGGRKGPGGSRPLSLGGYDDE